MKKATLNYWVDLATGVAFILCAVTGIVFLFPGAVHIAAGAAPTILFIPAALWHKVHDWTGVVIVAGTALHLALHARWIANMTRKTFGAKGKAAPAQSGRQSRGALPSPAADAGALTAAGQAGGATAAAAPLHYATAAEAEAGAQLALRRLEALRAERQREREQRMSRRRFLAGAAVVGGAALLAGTGILAREAASSAAQSRSAAGTGVADSQTGSSGSGSRRRLLRLRLERRRLGLVWRERQRRGLVGLKRRAVELFIHGPAGLRRPVGLCLLWPLPPDLPEERL